MYVWFRFALKRVLDEFWWHFVSIVQDAQWLTGPIATKSSYRHHPFSTLRSQSGAPNRKITYFLLQYILFRSEQRIDLGALPVLQHSLSESQCVVVVLLGLNGQIMTHKHPRKRDTEPVLLLVFVGAGLGGGGECQFHKVAQAVKFLLWQERAVYGD